AEIIRDRKVTCFFSIRDDVVHAGGLYRDAEVVVDGNIITSRIPDDLPAFLRAIIDALRS
ncbi:MAG TPA: DJ-1/PfpI family protein, partial [Syntrophales bacterium]|nr:DJ-1/PfpI family protein [Syntrophales bacterium]